MRIKFEIEGTEVTVDTKGTGEEPGQDQHITTDEGLPPELAAAVATGAISGGRAPQLPGAGMTPETSGVEMSIEDRSAGSASAGIEGPFSVTSEA
jgi:hypothetical protein